MAKKIHITAGDVEATAELNDTRTAQAIREALPIKGRVKLWGQEIYFSIPVELGPEGAQKTVSVGDLAYWPDGNAFCIFFGPTAASQANEIRPASPVTVFGKVIGDAAVFKNVAAAAAITVKSTE